MLQAAGLPSVTEHELTWRKYRHAGTVAIVLNSITINGMKSVRFSASGASFGIHEWRGSGPATLHVHHSDDEAWHVLEGELSFRYSDRIETVGPGMTVFVPAGVAHTYTAGDDARYLIVLTPRLSALIAALQADRDPTRQHEIYVRFDSEILE